MSKKLVQEEIGKRFQEKGWKLKGEYINSTTKVLTICSCGKSKLIKPRNIIYNSIKTCGHCNDPKLGDKFGALTVIKIIPYKSCGCKAECECVCGNIWIGHARSLRDGNTKSCGCIRYTQIAEKESTPKKEESLGYLYPEIIEFWSDKNKNSPFDVYPNSHHKYLFKCDNKLNHKDYDMLPYNKICGNNSCPYCAGRRILKGFNDLTTRNPELANEWDYKKNYDKNLNRKRIPEEFTCNSGYKADWKCQKCGHRWKTTINSRSRGSGCPKCNESKGEKKIVEFLDTHHITYIRWKRFDTCKNKNTLPFDFYLLNCNLLIEYQGEQHYKVVNYWGGKEGLKQRQYHDKIKQDWAKDNGYKLLIIPYTEQDNIEQILSTHTK